MASHQGPRRAGPVRARALAQKDNRDAAVSRTAWLDGAHEAIAVHPEWLQLRSHLSELAAKVIKGRLDTEGPHAHAIEAMRQVTGELRHSSRGPGLWPGPACPHLLHEPYMSAAGVTSMIGQTLKDLAREVDVEAEANDTLASAEYRAFHDLVQSVYVGNLQKRVEEEKIPQIQRQNSPSSPLQQHQPTSRDNQSTNSSGSDLNSNMGEVTAASGNAGVALESYQTCSGDIAQALIAIATGDGFDLLSTAGDSSNEGEEGGGIGKDRRGDAFGAEGTVNNGNIGGGERIGYGGNVNKRSLQFAAMASAYRSRSEIELEAEGALRYLSEDSTTTTTTKTTDGGGERGVGRTNERSSSERARIPEREGQIPGLGWLAPHIVGRSVPMTLRQEVWRRTLAEGGPSVAEVERLVARLALEKGIMDPTNTPIAGMVATGVRHRSMEAFPWLSRGGQPELALRQRVCHEAELVLNQHFVFSGRHEARHIAMSLVLAYVFDRGESSRSGTAGSRGCGVSTSRGGASVGGGGEGGALVTMLHSLSTRFAPGLADLQQGFRDRAYDEIRRRDAPLFNHLSAMFPAYKYNPVGREQEKEDYDDDYPENALPVIGDGSRRPRGLVEAWLEDAFVGYLREDALLFVWDQLFLLGWPEQLPLFVADVALHLRKTLLRATAPRTLLSMARDACRRIYTRDLRDAFRRRHATLG